MIEIFMHLRVKCEPGAQKQAAQVAIANKQCIEWVKIIGFLLCQKSLDIKIKLHVNLLQ